MNAVCWVNSASPTPGIEIFPLFLDWPAWYFDSTSAPPWALTAFSTTALASSSARTAGEKSTTADSTGTSKRDMAVSWWGGRDRPR